MNVMLTQNKEAFRYTRLLIMFCTITFGTATSNKKTEQKLMSEIVMVYITISSEEKAKEVVSALLQKRLIGCATIFPCNSMYWWENAIQNDQEFIILAKTKESKFESLEQEITKIHPYQVPCIIKMAATANMPYAQWLSKELDAST